MNQTSNELSDETLAHGLRAANAILGLDALYRKESGDDTGLAVLNMARPGELSPNAFADYGAAASAFEELKLEAGELSESDRKHYYKQLCESSLAFIRWRDWRLPFEEQLTGFLHVPAEPASGESIEGICDELAQRLHAMGFAGGLSAQCQAWEEKHRVPADEVPGVLNELLSKAWDRTVERVVEIPADKTDGMRCEGVTDVAFNARCDYLGRTIELNVEPTLTLPGLRHLAVHEGYPGHYVQFKLRETSFREGRGAADNLLSVVNTASSSVFEGIADAGLAAIGWDDGEDDKIQSLLNRHRAAIGTGAAWRLHALSRPQDQVTDWLRDQALVGGDGWVDNRMKFIAAPERAVLIWSYWWGEQAVAPAWAGAADESRGAFVSYLYERMHSNDTVRMFNGASSS